MRIHVSPDVHSRVAALAKRTGVSINTFVSNALDSQIAKLQP
jgi:predicted HicB family RNase H-like nuclease